MNINSAYISIDDTAAYFNINKATVRNWCDRGMLTLVTVGNKNLVSVESIREIEKNKTSITKLQQHIEKYLKETEEYKLILQGELNILKNEITQRHWLNNHIQYLSEMAAILLDTLTDKSDEDTNVRLVRLFLEGDDYKDIAVLTGLPVKQVMHTIRTFGRTLLRTRTYSRLLEMSVRQDATIRQLQQDNLELQRNIKVLQSKYDHMLERMAGSGVMAEDRTTLPEIDNIKLPSHAFSTRVRNILKSYDITTVGQLAAYSENDILKFTNMGLKSVRELTLFLQGLGLTWADKKPSYPTG